MNTRIPLPDHKALRTRAVTQLRGAARSDTPYADQANALRVLHDLAITPGTASQALALLHELQVHQVEVELQQEELRRTRQELEETLARQIQLYEAAPVACLCIEADTTLREANLTAERVFGISRELLLTRRLEGLLVPESRAALQRLLEQVEGGRTTAHAALQLAPTQGASRVVQVTVSRDPAGARFLVAIAESGTTASG